MTGLKMRQFLALRSDLFPPHVTRELSLLFEGVTPMGFAVVRSVINADLGEPLANLFSEFEPASIAAASIAQVHLARNREGERVAVKVQRAGLVRQFGADMRNVRRFASLIDTLGVMSELSVVQRDRFLGSSIAESRNERRRLQCFTLGTSTYISALSWQPSLPLRPLYKAVNGQIKVAVSEPTMAETLGVMLGVLAERGGTV